MIPLRLWLSIAACAAACAILALISWRLHHTGYTTGKAEVQASWNAERTSIAAQSLKLSEAATRATIDLQAKQTQEIEAKNVKIRALNAAVSRVLASLHDRSDRPTSGDLPTTSSTGPACTGASLYRPDGEFLIREAARADEQRLQLIACQAAYSEAVTAVNQK